MADSVITDSSYYFQEQETDISMAFSRSVPDIKQWIDENSADKKQWSVLCVLRWLQRTDAEAALIQHLPLYQHVSYPSAPEPKVRCPVCGHPRQPPSLIGHMCNYHEQLDLDEVPNRWKDLMRDRCTVRVGQSGLVRTAEFYLHKFGFYTMEPISEVPGLQAAVQQHDISMSRIAEVARWEFEHAKFKGDQWLTIGEGTQSYVEEYSEWRDAGKAAVKELQDYHRSLPDWCGEEGPWQAPSAVGEKSTI
jgi:hypothetical protein